ncbi:hypothetical protein WMY93_017571 [Mugilogobius chulae]|uniref:Uncharacterized protein n=1 Tax=Mugilogobius chulae TaxID=88201 RepID=A0AAW0NT30_9GOBI
MCPDDRMCPQDLKGNPASLEFVLAVCTAPDGLWKTYIPVWDGLWMVELSRPRTPVKPLLLGQDRKLQHEQTMESKHCSVSLFSLTQHITGHMDLQNES